MKRKATDKKATSRKGVTSFVSVLNEYIATPNNEHDHSRSEYEMSKRKIVFNIVLSDLMKEAGESNRDLAKSTGIPSSTIGSYRKNKKANYDPEHLDALSRHYGRSIEYLLFGEESRKINLNQLSTEEVFSGWLKVKIERAIPEDK